MPKKGVGKQKCTLCDKQSMSGFKKGHGKCQFHWYAGVYGIAWAKKMEAEEIERQNSK